MSSCYLYTGGSAASIPRSADKQQLIGEKNKQTNTEPHKMRALNSWRGSV